MKLSRSHQRQPGIRAQTSEVRRSYPGDRRVVDGQAQYETLHVDGLATVELDMHGLEQLVYQAVRNRAHRAKDGALNVRFYGAVESTWSPDQKAYGSGYGY